MAAKSASYQFVRPAAKVGSPQFAFMAGHGKIRGQGLEFYLRRALEFPHGTKDNTERGQPCSTWR